QSYFKLYKKNYDVNVCPNEIYVAVTRSLECVSLLHHCESDYLSFIDKKLLNECCNVIIKRKLKIISISDKNRRIGVTDLVRHLSYNNKNKAMSYIKMNIINQKEEFIEIPIKTQQNELYESVSEITGIAIPAYFELLKKGSMTICKDARYPIGSEILLIIANEYQAIRTGLN